MNNAKNRVQKSFNKSWRTYDDHCFIQQKIGLHLIRLLRQQGEYFAIIADIACGTGMSTQILMRHVHCERCYAIDFSANLLSVAKNKILNKKVTFFLSDFDEVLFDKNHLDLVFCNMGLQWSLDLDHTLKLFHFYLKESGLLVFAIPVHNSFPELKSDYKNSTYPLSEIKKLLEDNKFELISCHTQVYCENFNSHFDAISSMKAVGANCLLSDNPPRSKIFSKQGFKNLFIKNKDIKLTYHIGFFVARKLS